jgi:hypothetical protein
MVSTSLAATFLIANASEKAAADTGSADKAMLAVGNIAAAKAVK